jgi:HlyD family secretion protein
MTANRKRILVWTIIAVLVASGLTVAFTPRAVTVDLTTVEPAPMVVTVDEEGETRVHDVFVLSSPVAGRMRRIAAHVGELVVADETVLASIEPGDPTLLDPRSEAQAQAALRAAESALTLARAGVEQATLRRVATKPVAPPSQPPRPGCRCVALSWNRPRLC